MFTGIVTERGDVVRAKASNGSLALRIRSPRIARELEVGDSVAVNGVCLTATSVSRRRFDAHVTPETLARTTLGALTKGALVNLEPAARLGDRLGGHLVQGHIDGPATVTRIENVDGSAQVSFAAEPELLRHVVAQGSVALDGVSLTVVDVDAGGFDVALIPHTLEVTTLGSLHVGARVNLEVDLIAKYVQRLVERT